MRSRPESAGLLRGRAEFLTSLGQSPQALADIVQATEFEPGNHLNYHLLALAARLGLGEKDPFLAKPEDRLSGTAQLLELILVRVQVETNNPRPCTDASHPVSIRSQPWQARFQGSHHPGHV